MPSQKNLSGSAAPQCGRRTWIIRIFFHTIQSGDVRKGTGIRILSLAALGCGAPRTFYRFVKSEPFYLPEDLKNYLFFLTVLYQLSIRKRKIFLLPDS